MTRRPATAIIEALQEKLPVRGRRLDNELVPTDRIMQRWAVSVGDGLPNSEAWDDLPKSRVPQLDDDTAIAVDRIVQHLMPKYHRLALRWYKSRAPRQMIAAELGLPRTTLYLEWRALLWYLRGRFHGVGIDC